MKLFPTATNWRTTIDTAKQMSQMFTSDDLAEAAGLALTKQPPWQVALIPKVELKGVSQFDFIKSGATLITAPFPERALNTWTFTWDLTRVIPNTKTRIYADAIKDYERRRSANATDCGAETQLQSAKLCVTIFGTSKSYIKVLPTFSAESCQKLANLIEAEEYELACEFSDKSGDRIQILLRVTI